MMFLLIFFFVICTNGQLWLDDKVCPRNWLEYHGSCYKFTRSPQRTRERARENCQAYNADLLSINDMDEHFFVVDWLRDNDPEQNVWYISAHQQSPDYWVNDGDQTQLSASLMTVFAATQDQLLFDNLNYLGYRYDQENSRWYLTPMLGDEQHMFMCEIRKENLQHMIIDDRDSDYGYSLVEKDEIPRGPYFVQQPSDVVFDLPRRNIINDVSLRCLADGNPYPSYEWFKEEHKNDGMVSVKIDPLSDSRLTISGGDLIIHNPITGNDGRRSDRGSYHCVASNSFGSIVSESAQLSFGYIDEFNLDRNPESGKRNWGKAIYCDTPTAYPGVIYNWARDVFPNFVQEDKRTFVSYDGHLYFSYLDYLDEGKYSCNVQSPVSTTGKNGPSFFLKVIPHPNYQQLKFPNNFPKAFPEAPIAGQNVRLECVAFGYPVITYNWTRENGDLPEGSFSENYNRVLNMRNIRMQDQGKYTCTAWNDKVSKSSSVILAIQAKPTFTIPLGDRHMDSGADLIWTCEAFGNPDVTYTWLKNGLELHQDYLPEEAVGRYEIEDNVLIIRELDPERDAAMFQCKAENQQGATYSSGQLRVLTLKPSFAKYPLEPETYAGERGNVTIACNPEAAPRPKFTWRLDGIPLGTGGQKRILPNGHLFISPVSTDDEGEYTCEAENEYGSASSSGRLIVLIGPEMRHQLEEVKRARINDTVRLRCRARAEQLLDMAYVWKHNGLRINTENEPRYKIDSGDLWIHNVTLAEAGEYGCIARTTVGETESYGFLKVLGPPGPSGGVRAEEVTATSVFLRWTDGAAHGREIYRYRIEGKTQWSDEWMILAEDIEANTQNPREDSMKQYFLRDSLSPWSSYEFRVTAGNELGYGPPSQPSPQANTRTAKPFVAPRNVGGGGGKQGDVTITWDPLPLVDQNAPGVWYKVFWRRVGIDTETEWQSEELRDKGANADLLVVQVDPDRYFYTEYEVKVQAINDEGPGPMSDPVEIFSAEGLPQATPTQVDALPYNATALNVTWLPFTRTRDNIRGELIGFRVKYWKRNDDLDDLGESDSLYYLSRSTNDWALVVGLQPNTYYYIRAMVYNRAGQGTESEKDLERTYKSAPMKPPTSVEVTAVNPTTVMVTWRYVSANINEEPVMGYKVLYWEAEQDFSTAREVVRDLGDGPLQAYVRDLTVGKMYKLRVLAYSRGGYGKMSSPAWTFQMGDPEKLRD